MRCMTSHARAVIQREALTGVNGDQKTVPCATLGAPARMGDLIRKADDCTIGPKDK